MYTGPVTDSERAAATAYLDRAILYADSSDEAEVAEGRQAIRELVNTAQTPEELEGLERVFIERVEQIPRDKGLAAQALFYRAFSEWQS